MVVNVSVTWMDGKKAEYLAHWYQVRHRSYFQKRRRITGAFEDPLNVYSDSGLLEMETVGKGAVYIVLEHVRHFTVKQVEEVKTKNAKEAKA